MREPFAVVCASAISSAIALEKSENGGKRPEMDANRASS
jgi:hypothetical protein